MRHVFVVLASVVSLVGAAGAQQKPQPAPSSAEQPAASAAPANDSKRVVPLKVQIVLSRFKGEKKISSLPYVLGVASQERFPSNLRMGIDVPIAHEATPGSGFSYRSVGTNIDCIADAMADNAYRLAIRVEDSSVLVEPGEGAGKSTAPTPYIPIAGNLPAFRSFKSNFTVILRDGQTTQYTSAVDPVSGEVMKIDVTLNVIK